MKVSVTASLPTSTRLPKRSTSTTRPCASKSCTAMSAVSPASKRIVVTRSSFIRVRSMPMTTRPTPAAASAPACQQRGSAVKRPPCCSTFATHAGTSAAASAPTFSNSGPKLNSATSGCTGAATATSRSANAAMKQTGNGEGRIRMSSVARFAPVATFRFGPGRRSGGGGTRTRTGFSPQQILSLLCLPFHHAAERAARCGRGPGRARVFEVGQSVCRPAKAHACPPGGS